MAGRLTARRVATAKRGKHSDGGNLYLIVSEIGSRKWVLRFTWRGAAKEMGPGSRRNRIGRFSAPASLATNDISKLTDLLKERDFRCAETNGEMLFRFNHQIYVRKRVPIIDIVCRHLFRYD